MTNIISPEDEQILREALHQIVIEEDASLLQELEEANRNPDFAVTSEEVERFLAELTAGEGATAV